MPAGAWLCRLAWLAALVQAFAASGAVERSESSAELEVPGGPMASALIEIGQRYGVIVSFKPSLVERQVAPPIRGRYTLTEALALALRDSDLSADVLPGGAVTLHRVAAATPPQQARVKGGDDAGPRVSPVASEPQRDRYVLPPMVVYGKVPHDEHPWKSDDGLMAWSSDAATLTDTPLRQLPQAISVITRDMLALTQAKTQIDAMGYVAGVSTQQLLGAPTKVRGFPGLYTVAGMRTITGQSGFDSAVIERVEVLKGPAGAVGGVADEGGRGGLINVVLKRPYRGQPWEATLSASSQDGGMQRSTFDLGAEGSDTVWRLVGYGTRSGQTEGGYDARHGNGLLGAVTLRGADFAATLAFEHDRRRETSAAMARAIPSSDSAELSIAGAQETPVSQEDGASSRSSSADLELEWRLASNWRLTSRTRWERKNADIVWHQARGTGDAVSGDRNRIHARQEATRWSLIGDVPMGAVKHKLVLGWSALIQEQRFREDHAVRPVDPGPFVPGQTMLPGTPDPRNQFLLSDAEAPRWRQSGVLLQDQLSIGDLRVRLATRYSAFHVIDGPFAADLNGTNWDIGASYQLTHSIVIYAGAQSAFEGSHFGEVTLFDGSIAPAAQSRQAQAGAKFMLLDDRLAVTAEAYRMKQLNVVDHDSALGGSRAYVGLGTHSTGIELEAVGRLSPALEMALGLNVLRARDRVPATLSTVSYEAPATAVPARSMYMLGRYRLPEGLAPDTSIGMALRSNSGTWAVSPDPAGTRPSLRIPGGAQLDLSWTRQFGSGSLGISIMNVFDRRLYGASTDPDFVPLLPRRSLSVTLAFKG